MRGEGRRASTGARVTYGFGELDTLVPAYAATIHKSQGSEYPAAIIPVLTQHYAMLQRNLLYTGVTRDSWTARVNKPRGAIIDPRPEWPLFARSGWLELGRVEMWRGDVRLSMSVFRPFVWRCLSGSTVAPFPHPAHR